MHYISKYSPYTLPWNQKHQLTKANEVKLRKYMRKFEYLQRTNHEQKNSRLSEVDYFNDRFNFVDKKLVTVDKILKHAFSKMEMFDSDWSTLENDLARIEEEIHFLAVQNKKLKSFERQDQKLLSKQHEEMENQVAVHINYDPVRCCLTRNVVPLEINQEDSFQLMNEPLPSWTKSKSNDSFFGMMQKFWQKPEAEIQPLSQNVSLQATTNDNLTRSLTGNYTDSNVNAIW